MTLRSRRPGYRVPGYRYSRSNRKPLPYSARLAYVRAAKRYSRIHGRRQYYKAKFFYSRNRKVGSSIYRRLPRDLKRIIFRMLK